jgi:outer membrane protein assembly factor BamE
MLRALTLAAALLLGACSLLPEFLQPYRIDIQQGNFVSQEMVSQLKPGMSREQVRAVLGTPLLTDIFHAERWDYVYVLDRPGKPREQRHLSVIFEEGRLARLGGDVVAMPGNVREVQ